MQQGKKQGYKNSIHLLLYIHIWIAARALVEELYPMKYVYTHIIPSPISPYNFYGRRTIYYP